MSYLNGLFSDKSEVIEAFFNSDGQEAGGKTLKSIILAIKSDFQYLQGVKNNALKLTEEQRKIAKNQKTYFGSLLLFCSAVDVLARVEEKQIRPGRNGRVFKDCLIKNYSNGGESITESEATTIWEIRNAITHQYSLLSQSASHRAGSSKFFMKDGSGNIHIFEAALFTAF